MDEYLREIIDEELDSIDGDAEVWDQLEHEQEEIDFDEHYGPSAEDPNGFSLSAQPDSNASMWVNYSPLELEALTMGAGIRYVGESVSENGVIRYDTPSYTLGDLMMSYALSNNLNVQLNVRNVTDKKYLTSCLFRGDCFPGVRRTVTASLTYSF